MCGELIRGGREKQGAWKCNSKIREISKCTNILEVKLRELQTMQQLRERESKQSNRIAVYDSLEEKNVNREEHYTKETNDETKGNSICAIRDETTTS